jgi:hypothetical protein
MIRSLDAEGGEGGREGGREGGKERGGKEERDGGGVKRKKKETKAFFIDNIIASH